MHKLLSCDPSAKGPPLWQLVNPIPATYKTQIPSLEKQLQDTQVAMDYYFDLEPNLYMLHEMNAKNADECCHLFEQSWVDRHSPIISDNMDSYFQNLLHLSPDDQAEVYRFYKKTLKVMSFLNKDFPASHHVLKDATHSLFLDGLLQVFPDACILLLHRKPAPVAKSCLSGIGYVARYYYYVSDIDYQNLAKRTLDWMRYSQERVNETRKNTKLTHENAFYDIHFEEFIKDPVESIKKMYEHFGYEFSVEFEENMKVFLDDYNRFRKSKPALPHSLDPFGYSVNEINEMFSANITPNPS